MTFESEYDNWHLQMGKGEQATDTLRNPWHITTAKLLPDLQRLHVLEIGCGRGDFALWLARKAPEADITAIDFSDAAIVLAKRRAAEMGYRVRFEVGNAQSLRFDEDSFDVIISCE